MPTLKEMHYIGRTATRSELDYYKCSFKKITNESAMIIAKPCQKLIPPEKMACIAKLAAENLNPMWTFTETWSFSRENLETETDTFTKDFDVIYVNISVYIPFLEGFNDGPGSDRLKVLFELVKRITIYAKTFFPSMNTKRSNFLLFLPDNTIYDLRDNLNFKIEDFTQSTTQETFSMRFLKI